MREGLRRGSGWGSLTYRSNLEPVTYLGAGAIDCVRGKFQHAHGFEGHFGDAERADMLFNPDDFFFLAEKNEIDGEHHADGMYTARGHNPKAATQLCPAPRLPQQAYKPAEIVVGESGLRGHKGLAR